MPELNCMHCTIEVDTSDQPLRESDLKYGNQRVQCRLHVPEGDSEFSIRFATSYYSPPGLAVFVFIDGQYQANRNYTGSEPHIELRFRQKEEPRDDGRTFIGRAWRFSTPKQGRREELSHVDGNLLQHLGIIKVVVLRCAAVDDYQQPLATDILVSDSMSGNAVGAPPVSPLNLGHYGHPNNEAIIQDNSEAHEHEPWNRTEPAVEPYMLALNLPAIPYLDQTGHHRSTSMLRDPYIKQEHPQALLHGPFLESRGLNAQVTTGRGAIYSHPLARPKYLDAMGKPFAVFTFHYRREDQRPAHGAVEEWLERNHGRSRGPPSPQQGSARVYVPAKEHTRAGSVKTGGGKSRNANDANEVFNWDGPATVKVPQSKAASNGRKPSVKSFKW